ncbi:MAG: gas vesicle synthesis protein GvpA [Chloroflexi bacterium 13_1_40CM_4_68_4]|nr:MAG: gas vesicle synthesis protein GvpA [Chloroflexi bacterium 13_1_40CM_4_68_4]
MAVERVAGGTSLIDVLDRVLDKGIVIDAWVRISLVGIDLITVEARVVVASIDTYLRFAEQVGTLPSVARPSGIESPAASLGPITRPRRARKSVPES